MKQSNRLRRCGKAGRAGPARWRQACFANPHSPWERGTHENTNGLQRDFFPKGSDFGKITTRQLARVERMLNNRPCKCLNYRTPLEVLNALPGVALRN